MHLTVLRPQGQSKVTELARHILWLANGPGADKLKDSASNYAPQVDSAATSHTQNDPLEVPSPHVSVSHWQLYPE